MPLPNLLFLIWALWPLATYPGGKLFAPLIFLVGLFALPKLNFGKFSLPMKVAIALIFWICISSIWSPADEKLFSGNMLVNNFALEASYIRIALTLAGCFLFLKLVLAASNETLARVPPWIYAGVAAQFLIVLFLALARDEVLHAQGGFLVPTMQSMGRNANFLAMAVPLLLAGIIARGKRPKTLYAGAGLIAAMLVLVILLDGLAAVLALLFGSMVFALVQISRTEGFRILFKALAVAIFFAPAIAFGFTQIAPALIEYLPLSSRQRVVIWQATLEHILDSPLFGHGVNASTTWTDTYASRPEFLEQLAPSLSGSRIIPNHPHNMPMQLWAETGLVGVVLVIALLVLLGRLLPAPKDMALGPRIAACGLFGAAIAYFSVSYSVWDESFWASLAIVGSGVIVLHRKYPA